jgi:chromosome partitioning protein
MRLSVNAVSRQSMILTLTSRKGGCGKTVLAMVIASALAEQGADVALLDADPNGSVLRWARDIRRAPELHAYAEADAERLADLLPSLAEQHGIVVVDTAGFGNQAATVAAAAADLVLVPVAPGEADVMEAQRTVTFVAGLARSTRRTIPVRVVINRARRNTTLARHVAAEIARLDLPRLAATISEAVAYGEMSFSGAMPVAGAAAEEVAALMAELRGQGWLP